MRLVSKDILGSETGPEQSKQGALGELGTDAFQSARTGLGCSKRSFLEPVRPMLLSAEVLNRHRQIRNQQMRRDPSIAEARIRRRSSNIPSAFLEAVRRELIPPRDFGVASVGSSDYQLALVTPGTKP